MPHNRLKRSTPYTTTPKNQPHQPPTNQIIPTAWNGWYFEDDYLCTPEGDRFTPLKIKAAYFYAQDPKISKLMQPWPQCLN